MILSNWYLKTKATECTATEEPPRKGLYIEVFRSNLEKDDNGNVYESYPRSSQFGDTAWCIRDGENAMKKVLKYMQKTFSN